MNDEMVVCTIATSTARFGYDGLVSAYVGRSTGGLER